MPESIPVCESPIRGPGRLPPNDRREWLSLACELDRLKALRALRDASTGLQIPSVLWKIASAAPIIPGRIGKWIRGASIGATVCRAAILAFKD